MTKYDRIVELLQEYVDDGRMTYEQAEEINDKVYAKIMQEEYEDYEDDDDPITLENAMDAIADYLYEAKGDSPEMKEVKHAIKRQYKEDQKRLNQKFNIGSKAGARHTNDICHSSEQQFLHDNAKKLASKRSEDLKFKADGSESMKSIARKLKKHKDGYDDLVKIKNNLRANSDSKHRIKGRMIESGKMKNTLNSESLIYTKRNGEQKVFEDVKDLRLQVYDAYEEGAISEDEKDTFLDYLNINNYE